MIDRSEQAQARARLERPILQAAYDRAQLEHRDAVDYYRIVLRQALADRAPVAVEVARGVVARIMDKALAAQREYTAGMEVLAALRERLETNDPGNVPQTVIDRGLGQCMALEVGGAIDHLRQCLQAAGYLDA